MVIRETDIKFNMSQENIDSGFILYLQRKGLSYRTQIEYINYYARAKVYGLRPDSDQNKIDSLITKRFKNNLVFIAFIKNYLDYVDRTDIKIIKRTGRKKKRLPNFITKSEVDAILSLCDNYRISLMIEVMFQGGLRVNELINLKIHNFNWYEWFTAYNNGNMINGKLKFVGKGNKERIVFMDCRLMEKLYAFVKADQENIQDNNERIFSISRVCFSKKLAKFSKKAIDRHVNPHMLRHSTATHLLKSGWNLMEVKEYLGHEDISTTSIYTHIDKTEIEKKFKNIF